MNVLLSEVEARKNLLFKSVSTGVTEAGKKKKSMGCGNKPLMWFHQKFEAKRRISVQQRKKDTGGGQGSPDLSAFDERMAAIIGQSSLSGIIERSEGESDLIQEQLQHGNMLKSKSLF